MFDKFSRRIALKAVAFGSLLGLRTPRTLAASQSVDHRTDQWHRTHDRVWLGGEFWANPMEDWRVSEGWAECQNRGANRSVHSTTRQVTNGNANFEMTVEVGRPRDLPDGQDSGAGFRIGIRADINEHRANCFASGGIDAGIARDEIVLGDQREQLDNRSEIVKLRLSSIASGGKAKLTLSAVDPESDAVLATIDNTVPAKKVEGNITLVSQFSGQRGRPKGKGYRFRNWCVTGDAVTTKPEQQFGPILWSMYSLSDSRSDEGFVLKISALTGPLGDNDNQEVELQVQRDGGWQTIGTETLDKDAWVATFRIPNWDASADTPYRLVYVEKHRDGSRSPNYWTGTIKANPSGRPLRLGALTCQKDYAFPYEPVANNIVKLDPDMLYYSGDQLYEDHGGFGLIRDPAGPAILNYLRKYYMFGWSFRDAMRNAPTLCIPDDHDVFQGNIWGEGGAAMEDKNKGTSSYGGYREPARMVNAVHRTNCAHHPDFYDPTPVKQGISVYYGDMVYGGVSFAIVGDRQWKSSPTRVDTGGGREDHVEDRDFDTSVLDKLGLVLLGERQEDFLREWANDWRGHTMKVLLSQTVFAGVATHHGVRNGYLKADLDSGAWPQTARNRAIDIIRDSKALHINGDQHLTSLSQYGVREQRDSNWSFCTPAIAAGYPRWWLPDELDMPHANRPQHNLPNTGEFIDGFGNRVYVYAVGMPEVGTKKNRYELAHQKGSGFGLVTIDTERRTYKLDAFRFLIDATNEQSDNQFAGWPVVLEQKENAGENVLS